jgi:hypothetical protein
MKWLLATVCLILAAAALGQSPAASPATQPAAVAASSPASQTSTGQTVSMEHQLLVKRRILMGHESLMAVMQSNRQNWDRYSPEQRRLLRARAYAFRQADAAQQDQVLDALGHFNTLSEDQKSRYRQRAAWLTAVISQLPAETRNELIKLPADQRARKLLELKQELEAQGKLASQPASQPAVQ